MLILVGWVIISVALLGGFTYSGGHPETLFVTGEYVIIIGIFLGYIVASSSPAVLKMMIKSIITALKGSPYTQKRYIELIQAIYQMLLLARESGVIGLEEHVLQPHTSSILKKYPSFLNDHHAVHFLQDTFRPLMDGKVKPEEVSRSVEAQLDNFLSMHSQPTAVLTKASDALPGIGIVAAVLGIVITMASIAGDKQMIGEKVGHALVGTFLGLLLSYGFAQPLINRIETIHEEEISYLAVIGRMVISFALGAPPMAAAEAGRITIPVHHQPSCDDMEARLKKTSAAS
jgi:chemotaxis protein MotA